MNDRKDPWSVGAWMTPNPATVSPDLPARDAFMMMRREGYRHLVVVDGSRRVLGMVTDRDLRRPDLSNDPEGWNDYYRLDAEFEVVEVMTNRVETARTQVPLEKALKTLLEHKIGALPVLDKEEQLIGIITTHDLMRAFSAALDTLGERLRKG